MNHFDTLLKKIEAKTYTIGNVDLGYVWLLLMWTFHRTGMPVFGFIKFTTGPRLGGYCLPI